MERRKLTTSKSSPLPLDYLKMVSEVFTKHFQDSLTEYEKQMPGSSFHATGAIFSDEILLQVSLVTPGKLAATTVKASVDFNRERQQAQLESILARCVDAIGSIWDPLLSEPTPKNLEKLQNPSLAAFENVPFEWTETKWEKQTVHLKLDRSNPVLDQMAESWLGENDPEQKTEEQKEEKETEALFVTGKNRSESPE